jgi:HSP20 family protein
MFSAAFSAFGSDRFFDRIAGNWPSVEVSETDNEIKVTADLPGSDEKDVQVELANGVVAIAGEKKMEMEDKDRLFSKRHYGRFGRRIPVEDVDEANTSAAFKNGVLTVTLPKVAPAQSKVKRIAINGK